MKLYTFNGQQLPMEDILKHVSLSRSTIAKHIAAGRTTAQAMLSHRQRYPKPAPLHNIVVGWKDKTLRAPSKMGGQ